MVSVEGIPHETLSRLFGRVCRWRYPSGCSYFGGRSGHQELKGCDRSRILYGTSENIVIITAKITTHPVANFPKIILTKFYGNRFLSFNTGCATAFSRHELEPSSCCSGCMSDAFRQIPFTILVAFRGEALPFL